MSSKTWFLESEISETCFSESSFKLYANTCLDTRFQKQDYQKQYSQKQDDFTETLLHSCEKGFKNQVSKNE